MTCLSLSLLFNHPLKKGWKNESVKPKYFGILLWNILSIRVTVVNKTLLGETQSRIARNFPRLEIVIFNKNFVWYFSSCDYSILNSVNLAATKMSFLRQQLTFLAVKYSFKRFFNLTGFSYSSLDCDEFVL